MSGSYDKTIKIWDANTHKCIAILKGHSGYVYSVSFNTDSSKIVSGSYDKTINIWNVLSKKCLKTFYSNSSRIKVSWIHKYNLIQVELELCYLIICEANYKILKRTDKGNRLALSSMPQYLFKRVEIINKYCIGILEIHDEEIIKNRRK